jgi:hypothetical protein
MQRVALVIVPLVLLVGCREYNPASCENPANAEVSPCGMMPDGPPIDLSCKDDTGCTNPDQPVCKITGDVGVCVECTANKTARCADRRWVCTSDDKCEPCTRHTDCTDSNVCKPDGTCALENEVAYVDGTTGSDQNPCSKMLPCKRIEDAAMMTGKIVKVSGTLTERTKLDGRNVTILAEPGASLALSKDEIALEVVGTSQVEIFDLVITHTGSSKPEKEGVLVDDTADLRMTGVRIIENNADGVRVAKGRLTCTRCVIAQNTGLGINAVDGRVTISQSTIQKNPGGGILISANVDEFQIVGNVIFNNGRLTMSTPGSTTGGIRVSGVTGTMANRIDFNSLSRNETVSGVAPGIHCESFGTALTARYNIIWNNGTPPQFIDQDQVNSGIGVCAHMSSDIGPRPDPPSAGNVNLDPDFMSENNGDLHLMQSKVMLSVNPSTTELTGLAQNDIDDQPRGTGATDMGADHVPRTP